MNFTKLLSFRGGLDKGFYGINNARYVYTDESHFYTKNPYNEGWISPSKEFHEEQRKFRNQRISVYSTISRKAKFPLVYFTGNMDSKKYIEWVSEILQNIKEIFEFKFALYMDTDANHASVETLKWYRRCDIEIETGPSHSPDNNLVENEREIIKKSSRDLNSKNLMILNSVWRVFMMRLK